MKLLLDTSFLIALKKGDSAALKLLNEKRDIATEVGISRLTQYELLVGALYLWKKYGDIRELAWVEEALTWLKVFEIDDEVIKVAAEIKAKAVSEGKALPDMNLLIAVSGKQGTELLTLDEDQIKSSKDLEVKGIRVVAVKD